MDDSKKIDIAFASDERLNFFPAKQLDVDLNFNQRRNIKLPENPIGLLHLLKHDMLPYSRGPLLDDFPNILDGGDVEWEPDESRLDSKYGDIWIRMAGLADNFRGSGATGRISLDKKPGIPGYIAMGNISYWHGGDNPPGNVEDGEWKNQ